MAQKDKKQFYRAALRGRAPLSLLLSLVLGFSSLFLACGCRPRNKDPKGSTASVPALSAQTSSAETDAAETTLLSVTTVSPETSSNPSEGTNAAGTETADETTAEEKEDPGLSPKATADSGETADEEPGGADEPSSDGGGPAVTEPAAEPTPVPETEPVSNEISFVINIRELLEHPEKLRDQQLVGLLDESGYIYISESVELEENDTVYSVLERITQNNNIHMDAETTFMGKYVKAIHYLYEKAAGPNSGWTYEVNGIQPQVSSDAYKLEPGDKVVWRYIIGD